MTVAVIVDGASGLSEDLAARWGIRVLPLSLALGGRSIQEEELDEAGRDRATTSGPSPGRFAAAFDESPDGAVAVTVASTLSGSHGAAVIAARMADGSARVVDSGSAAGGQALVAIAAAAVARRGGTLEEVEAAAQEATRDVRLVGALGSLDGLVRSGRVPGLAALAGRMLNVNPLFELRDGHVRPLRPSFTREASLARMVEMFEGSRPGGDARGQVVALHAEASDVAERLLADVERRAPLDVAVVEEFGPALIVITGPGLVGLAWRWVGADDGPNIDGHLY